MARLCGYPLLQLLDLNFYELFPANMRSAMRRWGRALQRLERCSERGEFRILTPDGRDRWIDLAATPTSCAGQAAVLVIALDVTGRKQAEEAARVREDRNMRRADELSSLFETTRDLATQRDLGALLQTIVDRAARLLGSPAGSILLCSRQHDGLDLVVAHGPQDYVGIRLGLAEGISGQVARTLQPLVVDDYRSSGYASPQFDRLPIRAIVAVPMVFSGELVGVLTVYELDTTPDASPRTYLPSDVELLGFFASAAASAVHNARLFGETRQRLIELELLHQASLSSSQIHSPRAVAQRIMDTLQQLLNWQASLWLIEGARPVVAARNALGAERRAPPGPSLEQLSARIHSLDVGIVGWVCKTGRAVRSGDVRSDPRYEMISKETRSELCVPLKVGGRVIGCINVESKRLDAFNDHDERLLITLGNQAAVAIENARLFDETRRRTVRQAALNAIVTAAAQPDIGLDEILNLALDQVLKALGMEMGAIWLSWSPHRLQRVASRGIPPAIQGVLSNEASAPESTLAQAFVLDDWESAEHAFSDIFLSLGMQSTVVVPLLTTERRIGGLVIASPDSREWIREDVALVEAVGREVGLATERARLFEETASRLRELEAVNRVSTSLRLAQSLDEMLPNLIDETLQALSANTGGIWLYEPAGEMLRQEVGRGWCLDAAHRERQPSEGVLGHTWMTGDIYFSTDAANDPLASPAERKKIPAGWAAVCIPIRTEQETIGVLEVFAARPREFSGQDARLLVTLTEIAGNSIHRMRLNEQTARHAVELEARVAERTAELQAALEKAQAADRLKSDFIANINHELRTPLTNLILYHQLLRNQPTIKAAERLDVIGRELQRLRSLIEDLLNLSRFDLGHVRFNPIERDLNTLVESLVGDRRALAEQRGLILRTELWPGLRPIMLDEATLQQAVSNLLTNALNYTPSGGEVLVRTLRDRRDGEEWVGFSISDTGLGINEEDFPHLFDRFYRGKAGLQSGAPGTGLGLSIVKQVVEQHGGRLEVANASGGTGAVFTAWLPAGTRKGTA
jgi:PAS domain S-box-containing protein